MVQKIYFWPNEKPSLCLFDRGLWYFLKNIFGYFTNDLSWIKIMKYSGAIYQDRTIIFLFLIFKFTSMYNKNSKLLDINLMCQTRITLRRKNKAFSLKINETLDLNNWIIELIAIDYFESFTASSYDNLFSYFLLYW